MDKKNFGWICFWVGVLCLAVSSRTGAQDEVPRVEWERTFGDAALDTVGAVRQTADGGYIVAGWTLTFGAGFVDIYLIKLDPQGVFDPVWPRNPRISGGEGIETARSVEQTADGGYIVAGVTGSFGLPDVYLIKLDARGLLDPAWPQNPRTYGGPGWDGVWGSSCVQQTVDGGYIVAGWTDSFGAGERDVYLIKLDAQGDLDPAWPQNPRTFGGAETDEGYSVEQTADGGYIVAGNTRSFGAGGTDVYLIKLDAQGNLDRRWGTQWPDNPRTFGGVKGDFSYSVQQTADGGYIVAGATNSFGAGRQVYLIKLDPQGFLDPAWPQNPGILGGEDSDGANSVQQTADGGYIVAGVTKSFGAGDDDVYLMKLDVEGSLDPRWGSHWPQNPRTFGGAAADRANSVRQTADGGYIVAGSTESFGAGDRDVYLIKLAPVPTASVFRRGDANADGDLNLLDVVFTLGALFLDEAAPTCADAADADDNGLINVTDAVRVLIHLFGTGPAPPEPFGACGLDPTVDALDCAAFAACP